MKSRIVGFAGRIGSGKTTLAQAIAKALDWPQVSFGDYVRMEARNQGMNESREVLQIIGASLMKDPDRFCYSILEEVAWRPGHNLIIDGIRHLKILDSLRMITNPSDVFLIFVKVDEQMLRRRLCNKNIQEEEKLEKLEEHTTEAEVTTILPNVADLTVDGARPLNSLVQEIVNWLQTR